MNNSMHDSANKDYLRGITHRVASTGYGVQSSTVLLLVDDGRIPPIECGIFSDTQREPKSVYAWIEQFSGLVKTPVHIVSRGDLGADSLVVNRSKKSGNLYQKNLIPLFMLSPEGKKGILQRKCTSEYKIREIQKKLRQLWPDEYRAWRRNFKRELAIFAEAKAAKQPCPPEAWARMQDGAFIETLIGISTDEAERMKPSREPWSRNNYPLIDLGMSRQDCLDLWKARGLPMPPRSACYFCPYHSDKEWVRLQRDEPQDFMAAVAFEKAVQLSNKRDEVTRGVPFLHASRIPLDQVVFKDLPATAGDECSGVCEVA